MLVMFWHINRIEAFIHRRIYTDVVWKYVDFYNIVINGNLLAAEIHFLYCAGTQIIINLQMND